MIGFQPRKNNGFLVGIHIHGGIINLNPHSTQTRLIHGTAKARIGGVFDGYLVLTLAGQGILGYLVKPY